MKRSSASSSSSSYGFLKEPSPDLFPSKEDIFRLFGVIAIAVSVAITCNYGVNVLNFKPKPFCDSHGAYEDLTPEFCEPCPKNGECINGNLECIHGYKKHGRSCVEDGEINQTAKKLSELVKLHVCEAYVRFSCERIGTIWVQETELWDKLDEHQMKENFGLKNESYVYSKHKAMETIDSSLETRTDLRGIKELKCPDWLAEQYKPLSCYIRQWVYSHALIIGPVSALLVGIVTTLILSIRRIRRSQYLSTRAEQLYHQVCEILEENAIAANNVNGKSEPWVVASRLRDHLLLPKERRDPFLWKKVEELVQEDSRLDQYPKLVKGESKVVWEWQVEGSLSSSRKRLKEAERKMRISGHESPVRQQQTPVYRKLLNF
ncbi:Man1-src1p-carboxy-terminal domain protein [Thalictrum thalictroides]|uniref:Man1-src1p-carboxy-terminal domain protein n=1 Tax=Thalictrum thalictroides TaxID=46969 RepID=A0A7J6XDN1_THATH|nr:Man1-src1p-carboxy-terminal domain protein [Thalictrum thalictroides]